MRSNVIHHEDWCLSDSEREGAVQAIESDPPKAADVIGEFGLNIAAALTFALLVCMGLSAAGIGAP